MKKNSLSTLLALAVVAAMIAYFPPGPFSWHAFLVDPSSAGAKMLFLSKCYLVPALLAFLGVVGFRIQMGIAIAGIASASVFPLALLSSVAMMAALRSMSGGVGGVPGYAVGMALGYTLMSKIYGLKKTDQTVFGRPILKVMWRSQAQPASASVPQASAAA